MPDRVMVFIDYQNVHGRARSCFLAPGSHPADGHVDPLRLGHELVRRRRRGSELAGVRVYRGRPSPAHQPAAAAANDRQTSRWTRSELVTVIRRPVRYPQNWPDSPASEKGIDVALAVDMVRMAMEKAYDVAVLFSCDTDMMPAVETLIDLRLAHVEVAAWSGGSRLRIPGTQTPWCHHLDLDTYTTLRDTEDYTT